MVAQATVEATAKEAEHKDRDAEKWKRAKEKTLQKVKENAKKAEDNKIILQIEYVWEADDDDEWGWLTAEDGAEDPSKTLPQKGRIDSTQRKISYGEFMEIMKYHIYSNNSENTISKIEFYDIDYNEWTILDEDLYEYHFHNSDIKEIKLKISLEKISEQERQERESRMNTLYPEGLPLEKSILL